MTRPRPARRHSNGFYVDVERRGLTAAKAVREAQVSGPNRLRNAPTWA